jgi:hypothetical protein
LLGFTRGAGGHGEDLVHLVRARERSNFDSACSADVMRLRRQLAAVEAPGAEAHHLLLAVDDLEREVGPHAHDDHVHGVGADVDGRYAHGRRRAARRAAALGVAVRRAGNLYSSERLHQARIAAKKLRYALEVERELMRARSTGRINRLKRVQDLLGNIHDFEILIGRVREVQAAIASSDRKSASELDSLVRVLEEECREGHAAFLKQRAAIMELCRLVIEAARDNRPTFTT